MWSTQFMLIAFPTWFWNYILRTKVWEDVKLCHLAGWPACHKVNRICCLQIILNQYMTWFLWFVCRWFDYYDTICNCIFTCGPPGREGSHLLASRNWILKKILKESESGRRMSMIIKQKCTPNGDSCDTTQGAAKFLHKNIK